MIEINIVIPLFLIYTENIKSAMHNSAQLHTQRGMRKELILISKRMVQHALDLLLGGEKTLETTLGAQGVATLMEQEGRYIQHLLYGVPVKRGSGVEVIEDLVPVHGVKVRLRLPKAVKRAYLAPQREEIPFVEKGGAVEYEVEEFCCHQMVVLEY